MVNSGGTDSLLIAAAILGALCAVAVVATLCALARAKVRAWRLARERHAARRQELELEQQLPYLASSLADGRPSSHLPPLFRPKGYLSPGTREQWGTQYGRVRERA